MRLYLVTDRHATGGRPITDVVESALQGGVDTVQLREKELPTNQLQSLATELRGITKRHGARLLINDRIDIALAVNADGVHLPAASFTVEDARRLLGPDRIVAVSTHSIEEARQADHAGANFIVFGPVYDTPSKRGYGAPQGLENLRRAVDAVDTPVIAIGGIDVSNVADIANSGCNGFAVIRSVLAAPAPQAAAQMLLHNSQAGSRE